MERAQVLTLNCWSHNHIVIVESLINLFLFYLNLIHFSICKLSLMKLVKTSIEPIQLETMQSPSFQQMEKKLAGGSQFQSCQSQIN